MAIGARREAAAAAQVEGIFDRFLASIAGDGGRFIDEGARCAIGSSLLPKAWRYGNTRIDRLPGSTTLPAEIAGLAGDTAAEGAHSWVRVPLEE